MLLLAVQNVNGSNIVSWNESGKSFSVHNKEAFLLSVLPRFYKSGISKPTFKGFVLLMERWGFEFQKKPTATFRHSKFVRQNPLLCGEMRLTSLRMGTCHKEMDSDRKKSGRRHTEKTPRSKEHSISQEGKFSSHAEACSGSDVNKYTQPNRSQLSSSKLESEARAKLSIAKRRSKGILSQSENSDQKVGQEKKRKTFEPESSNKESQLMRDEQKSNDGEINDQADTYNSWLRSKFGLHVTPESMKRQKLNSEVKETSGTSIETMHYVVANGTANQDSRSVATGEQSEPMNGENQVKTSLKPNLIQDHTQQAKSEMLNHPNQVKSNSCEFDSSTAENTSSGQGQSMQQWPMSVNNIMNPSRFAIQARTRMSGPPYGTNAALFALQQQQQQQQQQQKFLTAQQQQQQQKFLTAQQQQFAAITMRSTMGMSQPQYLPSFSGMMPVGLGASSGLSPQQPFFLVSNGGPAALCCPQNGNMLQFPPGSRGPAFFSPSSVPSDPFFFTQNKVVLNNHEIEKYSKLLEKPIKSSSDALSEAESSGKDAVREE